MARSVLAEMTAHKYYQTAAWGTAVDALVVIATMLGCSVVLELFAQGPMQKASRWHLANSKSI
jgi:hypothetical protein